MKLQQIPPFKINEWLPVLSIIVVVVHCWVNFFVWQFERSMPFYVSSPSLSLGLGISGSVLLRYWFKFPDRRQEFSRFVGILGTAYLLYVCYGIWEKGGDSFLSLYFWVFLHVLAMSLAHPSAVLRMALVAWVGYTLAHYFASLHLVDYNWWTSPAMGLIFILASYTVMVRAEAIWHEAQAQRSGWAAAREQLENNELRLLNYSKRLEESNENLQEFAYVISHDLREPLRTITAYTQLLSRRIEPEKQSQEVQDFMHFIVDAAKRMDGQINGILEYSRVGRDELNLENFSMCEAVELSKLNLQAKIFKSNAKIECVGNLVPRLHADKLQVSILLQNLIGNAIKYRKPNTTPHILISCEPVGDFFEICIKDNGIGIEPPYLESIFGVFRRLHTRNDIEGSGIGLSICRRIVQRHGGKIWATSTYGEGSAFYFTLPSAIVA